MNALIITDVQNDFCPGGALAVREGDRIIPVINRLQSHYDLVVVTQDWHPADHGSFAANHPGRKPGDVVDLDGLAQILWPVHCVQGTSGADFHPQLDLRRVAHVARKGADPRIDSYSAFFDNGHRQSTGLAEHLKARNVGEVHLCGLALDYCVKFSALDAAEVGFQASCIVDACRPVNLHPDDESKAIAEMSSAGVRIVRAAEILKA